MTFWRQGQEWDSRKFGSKKRDCPSKIGTVGIGEMRMRDILSPHVVAHILINGELIYFPFLFPPFYNAR